MFSHAPPLMLLHARTHTYTESRRGGQSRGTAEIAQDSGGAKRGTGQKGGEKESGQSGEGQEIRRTTGNTRLRATRTGKVRGVRIPAEPSRRKDEITAAAKGVVERHRKHTGGRRRTGQRIPEGKSVCTRTPVQNDRRRLSQISTCVSKIFPAR